MSSTRCPWLKTGSSPSRPGIGIDLLPDADKIRPTLVNPNKMRPHKDGFIVDQ